MKHPNTSVVPILFGGKIPSKTKSKILVNDSLRTSLIELIRHEDEDCDAIYFD